MLGQISHASLTKQISIFSAIVILCTMGMLTLALNFKAQQDAKDIASTELKDQVETVNKVLDEYFKAVSARADRQFRILENWLPGPITEEATILDTNGRSLPTLKVGEQIVNGNPDLLNKFKSLTDNDIAFLSVYQGKVYRASTLLKKDGKPMHGSEISQSDPVGAALTAGKDYHGLTYRNGKFFYSKVTALKDSQGRVFAGLSLRISLDAELGQIRNLFGNIKVAQTGLITLLSVSAKNPLESEWILHPSLATKALSEMPKDSAWLNVTSQLLDQHSTTGALNINLKTGEAQNNLFSTGYSQAWNWLIVVSAPTEEYLAASVQSRDQIILAGITASIVCAIAIFMLLRNRLRPLGEVAQALQMLGQGNLAVQVSRAQAQSHNEIDIIGTALNDTALGFKKLIKELEIACNEIERSSSTLVEQAQLAKDYSEKQFDASSDMSATVEEMHGAVTMVAESAADAAAASAHVIEETARGRQMVAGTVNDMGSIATQVALSATVVQSLGENSQRILNIVTVIQDIADKTNLLALNAAIEAARAGEQGKGFAVVADEVRRLSEQTRQSTREISTTVQDIVAQTSDAVNKMSEVRHGVGEGVERAQQAGSALDEIDHLIEHSAQKANEIAHSTSEQKVATERFAQAVQQVTELAERNRIASDSSEAAATQMTALAIQLKTAMQQFKTN